MLVLRSRYFSKRDNNTLKSILYILCIFYIWNVIYENAKKVVNRARGLKGYSVSGIQVNPYSIG
jgi:hypothetical protein